MKSSARFSADPTMRPRISRRLVRMGQPAVILRDHLLPRGLELTYTAWDLEPIARDCLGEGMRISREGAMPRRSRAWIIWNHAQPHGTRSLVWRDHREPVLPPSRLRVFA